VLHRYADPKRGGLKKCAKNPDEHAHFGEGCGWCALEVLLSRPIKTRPTVASPKPLTAGSPRTTLRSQGPGAVPLAPMVRARGARWFLAAVFAAALSFIGSENIDRSPAESDLPAGSRNQALESSVSGRASPGGRGRGIVDNVLDSLGIGSRNEAVAAQNRNSAFRRTSSGAPLSPLETRCVEMNVEAGKMSSRAAADYCYAYYSDQRSPATRQIESLLSVRGLDGVSVRKNAESIRVTGTLSGAEDLETLTGILEAVGLSQPRCAVASLSDGASRGIAREVRCEAPYRRPGR